MVYSLRDRTVSATPTGNRFLGVVLNAMNACCATTELSAHATPSETGSMSTGNFSIRNGRRTRYVVAEVTEETTPSSQSTTFTTLTNSDGSSLLSPITTPILSSTTRDATHHSVSPISDTSMPAAEQSSKAENANRSSFFLTLGACIDDIVYEHALQRKGVSLYVIKKYLEEKYCYDSWHFRKSIRNYIVESLANGQLMQVSGRGANGSVRLSQRYRRKFMRAKLQYESFSFEKVSNKSRSIKHVPRSNKTNSKLGLDTFIKATHTSNLTNLTSIRLNRRLIIAKRKTKSIYASNAAGQSLVHIPSQTY